MLCDGCNKDFNEKDLIEYNPKTFLCKDCLTFIQYHIHSNSYRPNNFGLTKDRNGLYIGVTFCIGTDKFSNFYNLLKTYSPSASTEISVFLTTSASVALCFFGITSIIFSSA